MPARPRCHELVFTCLLALALPGCSRNGEPAVTIADRLTSIDGYHVEFSPSSGTLIPSERAAEADAWRALVRATASQVARTASASNVYGDRSLWTPLLENDRSDVSGCNFRNDSARFLRVVRDGDEIRSASVEAAYMDRRPIDGAEGFCDLGSRNLEQFIISAANFPNGGTTNRLDRLEVTLGSASGSTTDPWEELDFATLSATGDASIGEGAAQFAFLVVDKEPGWQNNFEEVFLVTKGSYFGDLK
ncbi:MAG: hypothetical protein P8125_12010 [Gemmatimonadota bacterium]